jgi:hypothetical protein
MGVRRWLEEGASQTLALFSVMLGSSSSSRADNTNFVLGFSNAGKPNKTWGGGEFATV